MEFEIN
jgi:hypothetical protein